MKVIKKGRPQTGWAKQLECTGAGNNGGGCGALLLVEKSDLFSTCNSDYKGDIEYYTTFKCCECGVLTDVTNSPFYGRDLPTRTAWEHLNEKGATLML